jgi:hypothetical protein
MPTVMDPAVEALAQTHRVAQIRNAAIAAWLIRRRWLTAVAGGKMPPGILSELISLIMTYRGKAGLIAAQYGSAAHRQALGDTGSAFTPQVDVPREKLVTSLAVVGLQPGLAIQKKLAHADDPTMQRALLSQLKALNSPVAAATLRHVADAGRDTVKDIAFKQDGEALGYVRITKARCCAFCAMLATRGPVYSEDSFGHSNSWFDGDGPAKVHDSCNCSLALVYSDAAWPTRSVKLQEAWQPGMSLNEWRQFYEKNLRDTLA